PNCPRTNYKNMPGKRLKDRLSQRLTIEQMLSSSGVNLNTTLPYNVQLSKSQ
ncbi:hypothetical protein J6590_074149, partial [Homalodisca vitripennis]